MVASAPNLDAAVVVRGQTTSIEPRFWLDSVKSVVNGAIDIWHDAQESAGFVGQNPKAFLMIGSCTMLDNVPLPSVPRHLSQGPSELAPRVFHTLEFYPQPEVENRTKVLAETNQRVLSALFRQHLDLKLLFFQSSVLRTSKQTCIEMTFPAPSLAHGVLKTRNNSNAAWNNSVRVIEGRKVRGAPPWLIQRMEALRKLPPPTLEQVETSFRASEETRSKRESNLSNYRSGRKREGA